MHRIAFKEGTRPERGIEFLRWGKDRLRGRLFYGNHIAETRIAVHFAKEIADLESNHGWLSDCYGYEIEGSDVLDAVIAEWPCLFNVLGPVDVDTVILGGSSLQELRERIFENLNVTLHVSRDAAVRRYRTFLRQDRRNDHTLLRYLRGDHDEA